ncbi:glycosyltransferase family A protein [Aurantimonas sp. VKM B-3413]|uniref:glycosyltransferase family A protein n=1 Tax=Aurantimonas sp. VKM B-3413 TaxID=2779401 RepID=UPI001E563021|nr:glycosyltransferase family A protein [Aurantimonas sp. VKM B-3413]MCB8839394.1 glycosyltransferase family 2 protein [Aurantimonas sp. VKM B-3413]
MTVPSEAAQGERRLRRLGVVIPVYGHARFAVEAVESACGQDLERPLSVVVIDDGCPDSETQAALAAARARHAGRLITLRQVNGGLSAARNLGVRTLLDLHADLDAIFFLDADNRLEPYALSAFAAALDADPGAGWAFPDVHAFGLTAFAEGVDIRETAIADAPFRHLRGNICEAGSLVRSAVFAKGIFYDETMRLGLEDWDFWLSAREKGFHGVRVKDSGFLYRVRPESMVAQSRRRTEEILAGMQRKHQALFSRRAVLASEQAEAPRFLMADLSTGAIRATSDPCLPGRSLSLAETAAMFSAYLNAPNEAPFPPVLVAHHGAAAAPGEWPLYLRSLLFDAMAQKQTGSALLEVQPLDHASRFFGDPRQGRRVASRAQALIALIRVEDLNRLVREQPRLPGLAILREIDRIEHWTVPALEPVAETAGKDRRLSRLSALLRPLIRASRTPPLRHATRLYRGPILRDVREKVTDDLCGMAPFGPFPFITDRPVRCLVSVAPEVVATEPGRTAFAAYCERLRAAGLALSLLLDGQTKGQAFAAAHAAARPDNVVLDPEPAMLPAAFSFMGSVLPVEEPASFHRLSALIRGHDVLAGFGLSRTLPLAGAAKGDGVVVINGFPDALLDLALQRGQEPATVIAAYEHAHHAIAAGPHARHSLTLRGVPASRLVAEDHLGFAVRSRLAGRL